MSSLTVSLSVLVSCPVFKKKQCPHFHKKNVSNFWMKQKKIHFPIVRMTVFTHTHTHLFVWSVRFELKIIIFFPKNSWWSSSLSSFDAITVKSKPPPPKKSKIKFFNIVIKIYVLIRLDNDDHQWFSYGKMWLIDKYFVA